MSATAVESDTRRAHQRFIDRIDIRSGIEVSA
jgi:hypothetical protein